MKMERLANVALLVTCAAVTTQLVYSYFLRPAPRVGTYHAGERIGDTPELGLKKVRATVLLMTASTCHYCNESMPFFQRLVASAQQSGVRVLGVSAEPPTVNREYLVGNGVKVGAVVSALKNRLKMGPTPTVLLIRSDGVVAGAWVGRLDSHGEARLLHALTTP